ncbi:MAG: hypothetical protein JNK63_00075 [Chthonomonas sp.]|nr:hypothetical protein [Chthonomonas sp.]
MRYRWLFALVAAGLASQAFPNKRIMGWGSTRGGESSLQFSANYSATRTMISLNFPGATISSTDTIAPTALQNVDIIWLGVTTSFNSAITPLSASEKTALLRFIQEGGTAVLFADNSTFSAGAVAANNSLMNPLGLVITGTLNGTVAHTFVSPGTSPFTGPFGGVVSLNSGFPGWFAFVPPTGEVLSTAGPGGNALFATIPPDGLGEGSGRCWLFADSGQAGTGGVQGANWNTLFANMIEASTARVAGQVTLADCVAMTMPRSLSLKVMQGSTTVATSTVISTAVTDYFSIGIPMGVTGAAELIIDASPHLRRRVPITLAGGGLNTGVIVIENGDVDDSGEVDAADIDAVIADFGDIWPNGDGNSSADADNSGEVDAADIDLVISAFGSVDE